MYSFIELRERNNCGHFITNKCVKKANDVLKEKKLCEFLFLFLIKKFQNEGKTDTLCDILQATHGTVSPVAAHHAGCPTRAATEEADGQMWGPWTTAVTGSLRLLRAPSYCQEVENLVFGCLSFSGFSPSVVSTYVIPAPLRALCRYDLSHYRTWKRCHEMGTDLCQVDLDSSSSSTTDQLCGSGPISLSFQATISSFLNGNNKTYQSFWEWHQITYIKQQHRLVHGTDSEMTGFKPWFHHWTTLTRGPWSLHFSGPQLWRNKKCCPRGVWWCMLVIYLFVKCLEECLAYNEHLVFISCNILKIWHLASTQNVWL